MKIAVLHSDDWRLLERTICGGQWDMVCHGHTHRRREEHAGATLILNPGTIDRTSPRSFAVVDLLEFEVTSVTL